MDPLLTGSLGIAGLLVLIISGMPVGAALFTIGAVGLSAMYGPAKALLILQKLPFEVGSNYSLVVVPMFILMGLVAARAGLMKDLFDAAQIWLARFRGSLFISTISASAGFAAVSGSTVVNATVFTRIAYPEMVRLGYRRGTAAGVIAASGTLAAFIPPSIVFVLYALLTQQSVGKLLLAGIIPGLLTAFAYVICVMVLVRVRPDWAPRTVTRTGWNAKFRSLKPIWSILLLSFIILGGIYSGAVPPSAAGSVGAVGAVVITFAMGRLDVAGLWQALKQTVEISAVLFVIVIGGLTFSRFLVFSGFVGEAIRLITDLGLGFAGFMILVVVLFIVLGMFLDALAIMVIAASILVPVVGKMGMDPIWFAVIVVKLIEVGVITPPVGINLFAVMSAIGDKLRLTELYAGVIPFILVEIVVLALLISFPLLATWLPSTMGLG